METILQTVDARGVARLTLNRPDRHNAFDDTMIAELTCVLQQMADRTDVRLVILASVGKSFSAGADLNWMRRVAAQSATDNQRDATSLATLMQTLNTMPQATLGLVQGAAYGGGVGLVACCDIVIAAEPVQFCLSEVRLGLIPAVISPYVIAAIGARQARRFFLTAEQFSAGDAMAMGLVHHTVPLTDLEQAGETMIETLLQGGPAAQQAAKALVPLCESARDPATLHQETARRIADCRASDEGKEGMAAFLERRPAAWTVRGSVA